MFVIKKMKLIILVIILFGVCRAQFIDNFDKSEVAGWDSFTGDGAAKMDFISRNGYARIDIDATEDKHNVWWAVIKRNISPDLDLKKLKDPDYELRVEAKVKLSDAPRRINFMINTQRTTNFHKHLMEYDIEDTTDWHTISYTTEDLDAVPGDSLYVQLGVTDWGLDKYHVDLDHYKAKIVNINEVESDKGCLVPYHPPIPELNDFSEHLNVDQDAIINSNYPEINFKNWSIRKETGKVKTLTIDSDQYALLRWNFDKFKEAEIDRSGVLELTTYSVKKGGDYVKKYGEDLGVEFGKIRVVEILGGDPDWNQTEVSYKSFTKGKNLSEVINGQMIYDVKPAEKRGSKTYITISKPVMQRLIEGKTKGLLIRPLGAINSTFYDSEAQRGRGPKLHFDVSK